MTAAVTRRTRGIRNGGRSDRVVRAVIRAALDEIARVGYGPLRVDDVAARAGVNKTSVYRRWPTKPDLVDAAIRAVGGSADPLPDTGSIRRDLVEILRRALAAASSSDGRAIVRLFMTEGRDPDVQRITSNIKNDTARKRIEVVKRAQRRGEIPASADARLVVDAIVMPLMTRALRDEEPVDDDTIVRLVDIVLTGVEHGAGATS
jgi:AcrR family transcriptional regulator